MPNQEATTVAELLVKQFICRFGVPLLIHSDQGRNFESELFAEMCMKQRYDPLLEHQPLEAGGPLWLYNPQRKKGLTPKMERPWQGPYVITKRINDLVYRTQLGPRAKPNEPLSSSFMSNVTFEVTGEHC